MGGGVQGDPNGQARGGIWPDCWEYSPSIPVGSGAAFGKWPDQGGPNYGLVAGGLQSQVSPFRMEWVQSSEYSGFQHAWFLCLATPLRVLIVWGLDMEALDMLTSLWPGFLTCEMDILLRETGVGTSTPLTSPGPRALNRGSQYFTLHLKAASLTD